MQRMFIRICLRFIFLAACVLAWIGSSPDAIARQRQQGWVVSVVRPVLLILIRNLHEPLLRVIDVAPLQADA